MKLCAQSKESKVEHMLVHHSLNTAHQERCNVNCVSETKVPMRSTLLNEFVTMFNIPSSQMMTNTHSNPVFCLCISRVS